MIIDKALHKTFITQLESYINTLERVISRNEISEYTALEYRKQFFELCDSINRVDQYEEAYLLMNIGNKLPSGIFRIFDLILTLLFRQKISLYSARANIYFMEIKLKAGFLLDYIKLVDIQ